MGLQVTALALCTGALAAAVVFGAWLASRLPDPAVKVPRELDLDERLLELARREKSCPRPAPPSSL
jgi:hypothetical protein